MTKKEKYGICLTVKQVIEELSQYPDEMLVVYGPECYPAELIESVGLSDVDDDVVLIS